MTLLASALPRSSHPGLHFCHIPATSLGKPCSQIRHPQGPPFQMRLIQEAAPPLAHLDFGPHFPYLDHPTILPVLVLLLCMILS